MHGFNNATCKVCGIEFHTTESKISNGRGIYCSKNCADVDKKTGVMLKCLNCGCDIYSKLKSNTRFCSKPCYYEWLKTENRKHKIQRPINPQIDGSTRIIHLTQGQCAIVDSIFYEYINQFKWHASFQRGYRAYRRDGKKLIAMSRDIMNVSDENVVDHINHDTLDNRVLNLRVCSNNENRYNTITPSQNSSGYKGVSWHARAKKWRVRVKDVHVGFFTDKIEAAKAYDKKATELFGEFAHLNFKNVMEEGE